MDEPSICPTCFNLDLDKIPFDQHRVTASNPQMVRARMRIHGYSVDSSDLRRSAAAGCQACQLLRDGVESLVLDSGLESQQGSGRPIAGDGLYTISMERHFSKEQRPMQRPLALQLVVDDVFYDIELYTPPHEQLSAWPSIGRGGEVPSNPSASECAHTIQQWLRRCCQQHEQCRGAGGRGVYGNPPPLPRRILDVHGGQIVLAEPGAREAHYVALSHCWGQHQPPTTTTRETLDERRRGIPMHGLPRTFQDAVQITRALDLRYLWIDSLCIVQDDAADWEEQSSAMGSIYAQCLINLAATRASSAQMGFLAARTVDVRAPCWIDDTLAFRTRSFKVASHPVPSHPAIRMRLLMKESHEALQTPRWVPELADTAPLMRRGWVYQERMLSPRTVHFHAHEMLWDCRAEQRCECGDLDASAAPGGDGYSVSKHRMNMLGTLDAKQLHGLWRTLVEDYALLKLTEESDRLPALSGLARAFAKYLPGDDEYLAGLWRGDLARNLLWHGGPGRIPSPSAPAPPGSAAPSWSWASRAWGDGMSWEDETKPALESRAGTWGYRQDPRVSILGAWSTVRGENKYGESAGGMIVLEGPAFTTGSSAHPEPDLDTSFDHLRRIPRVPPDLLISLASFYDAGAHQDRPPAAGTTYYLVIGTLTHYTPEPQPQLRGLILQPSSRVKGALERIGTWDTWWTAYDNFCGLLDDTAVRRIEIV